MLGERRVDFESRQPKVSPKGYEGCKTILTDTKSSETIAGLDVKNKRLITREGNFYWKQIALYTGDIYHVFLYFVTFFRDPDQKDIAWSLCIQRSSEAELLFCLPKGPSLLLGSEKGRLQVSNEDGQLLATAMEAWRDSDVKRGVTRQFRIEREGDPMESRAIYSLFAASKDFTSPPPLYLRRGPFVYG